MGVFRLFILIAIVLLVSSMSEPLQVPPELRNLRAKVIDRKGVVHELTSFMCNEGGSLKFKKGTLDYNVSLSSIKSMETKGEEEGRVKVLVSFRDGKKEEFELPSSTRCTAQSDTGSVSFYINEVKKIELLQGDRR